MDDALDAARAAPRLGFSTVRGHRMEPDNRIRLPDAPDETVLDRPMRVLLVEDDDGDAIIVEDELELSGAPVAVRRVRSLAEARGTGFVGFDCALLDLNLPDTTGLDGLRALRAAAPDLAVLVLTGLDDERRGVEAVASGRAGLPRQGPRAARSSTARSATRWSAAARSWPISSSPSPGWRRARTPAWSAGCCPPRS